MNTKSILALGLLAAAGATALDQCTICKHVEERFWAVDRQINGRDRYDACVNFFKYDPADCEFIKVNTACRRACNYNPNRFEMEEEIAEEAEEFELTEEELEDLKLGVYLEGEETEAFEMYPAIPPKFYLPKRTCSVIGKLQKNGVIVYPKGSCGGGKDFRKVLKHLKNKKRNNLRKYKKISKK